MSYTIKPSVRKPKHQKSPLILAGFFTFLLLWGGIFSLAFGQNERTKETLTENQARRQGRSAVDSSAHKTSTSEKWTLSGYIESYYGFDFGQPFDQLRPDFFFNFKRHNEFNINLALAQASYRDGRHRATLALMAGNYAQFNLADEPTWAQFLYEARWAIACMKKCG
ncbi:hypothetical protein A3SI_12539 [Nitritalea halalkaliphila LW7]|uniref:Uncharacterized protein n=1 Tax=Nitritalea halalkaliphila LW7 TaxID=1189621 RepID=I5C1H7_9BACT|nr:outer membrane beta-barrel protein [Nitritalea halalkaliphila]EIM75679.1 hypothetical protein A3SI_12539 [Nitritalea halalkaliphila LW7]